MLDLGEDSDRPNEKNYLDDALEALGDHSHNTPAADRVCVLAHKEDVAEVKAEEHTIAEKEHSQSRLIRNELASTPTTLCILKGDLRG